MSRAERFKLKSQLLERLQSDDWSWSQTNLLLTEFGLDQLSDDFRGPSLDDIVSQLSESVLIEMYSLVFDIPAEEVADVIEAAEASLWKPGYVRLFITHSAKYKEFVGEVSRELAVVGIHGFVAHETMQYSHPWQVQIEHALRSMDAFVAIVHPEMTESAWCNQEVGWALGRRVPHFAVRVGADPDGFIASKQWPSGNGRSAKDAAISISTWAFSIPELSEIMVAGLLAALRLADNYVDAGATAKRIASLGCLTDDQWDELAEAYWSNSQAYTSVLVAGALQPFYERCGRHLQPPRPTAREVVVAPPAQPEPPPF